MAPTSRSGSRHGGATANQRRANRSERRAAEIRSAQTVIPDEPRGEFMEVGGGATGSGASAPRQSPATRRYAARRRPVPQAFVLTRDQEFAFIRADLRRMLITASTLLVIMLALLFILG